VTVIEAAARVHQAADPRRTPHTWYAGLLLTLAAGVVLNTVLGPLVTGVVSYPIAETVRNQLIGLELVSVGLVVPMAVVAAVLALRGHRAAGVLGFGPAAYTAYMFLQYVLGPEYRSYAPAVWLHLGLFTLGGALAAWGFALSEPSRMPTLTRRAEWLYGIVLLLLAGFVTSRYLGTFTGSLDSSPLPAESAGAPTFFWSIVLLDLGVVVPATVVAGIALIRGGRWAHPALYAILGWFALVPPSVAAMGATMLANDDPYASAGQVVVLSVLSLLFAGFAVWVYRPLFSRQLFSRQLFSRPS
jgi:hypothetical protein